jgi:hypothetical protein
MATELKTVDGKTTPPDFEKLYRLITESKKQWQLRKRFLETYWDKYDEDRLLCLAR